MRLINTTTLKTREFFYERAPPYAILSHRWRDQEVSYAEFTKNDQPVQLAGYSKVVEACRVARSDGHQWIWVDAACIDKSSSAELSEAINSMYEYYSRSQVCYAYLDDVRSTPSSSSKEGASSRTLPQSEWFSRGFTLQELLAPKELLFLNSAWQPVGTKAELAAVIAQITNVPEKYLLSPDRIHSASVAARMSWAALRTTTRSEDVAYCLLGLFNVNMPLLYGERGERAFFRLQLEIAKLTDDESIFAWIAADDKPCGMFAKSPAAFANSGSIKGLSLGLEDRIAYQWTNKGLELHIASRLWNSGIFSPNKVQDNVIGGEPHKLLTLGCFSSHADVDMRDEKAVKRAMAGKVVCVELQRIGPAWKRMNGQRWMLQQRFERYSGTSQRKFWRSPIMQKRYYVQQ